MLKLKYEILRLDVMTVFNAKAGETSVEEVVEGLLLAIPESRLD